MSEVMHNQSSVGGCFAFMRKREKKHFTSTVCDPQPVLPLGSEHLALAWVQAVARSKGVHSPALTWAELSSCCSSSLCCQTEMWLWGLRLMSCGKAQGRLGIQGSVWSFGCCRFFCQYCAFAGLVSFSTTNFLLCYFKLTCLVVLFD